LWHIGYRTSQSIQSVKQSLSIYVIV